MTPESNKSLLLCADLRAQIEALLSRYPTRQAATLPVLHLVNERLGFVPPQAVVEIAELLQLAPAAIQDTLSFYGFFKQDKPQGQFRVWVCRSISCAACGGEELLEHLCGEAAPPPRRNHARRPRHPGVRRMSRGMRRRAGDPRERCPGMGI